MAVAESARGARRASSRRRPVVAIGVDAAEPTLVRDLIGGGALPTLSRLLADGTWTRVESPADVGSGAVWPTFTTAAAPGSHEICSFWTWDPERMAVAPVSLDGLRTVWSDASARGLAVAVVDVPFTSPGGGATIEIVEWGAHDAILRKTSVLPRELAPLVRSAGGDHPFSRRPLDAWGSVDDEGGLATIAAQCVDGARRRGALARQLWSTRNLDLLLLVFTEVHRASHLLWHTVADDGRAAGPLQGALLEIYREVDRQIGQLLQAVDPEATGVVFSLHGMRASAGVRTTLEPLLQATGHARVADVKSRRRRSVVAAARGLAPPVLKTLYHRLAPAPMVARTAGPPDAMPPYDWSRTTAIPLPTDQHGWIRINLAGRERLGIVPPEAYERACADLEQRLLGLRTVDGASLVTRVLRPVAPPGSPPLRLPDLVVHWADGGDGPVHVREPAVRGALRATHLNGQHAADGFAIARGPGDLLDGLAGAVSAQQLLPLLLETLER